MMKKSVKTYIKECPIRVIPLLIFALILVIATKAYLIKIEYDNISHIQDRSNRQTVEEKKEFLRNALDMGYKITVENSQYVSKKMELEILKGYDMNRLKDEFNNKNLSDEFYSVLKHTLYPKDMTNSLFNNNKSYLVATKEGVLAIFSNSDISDFYGQNKIVSWEDFANMTHNPELTSNALDICLNNKNIVSIWQKDYGCESDILYDKMNIEDIIDMYLKNGKECIKPYYFLTASYITDDGDIFGTDDSTYLNQNQKYKMVILQSTSIYEILSMFEKEIGNIDSRNALMNNTIDNVMSILSINSIVSIVLILLIAISLAVFYNNMLGKIKGGDKEHIK